MSVPDYSPLLTVPQLDPPPPDWNFLLTLCGIGFMHIVTVPACLWVQLWCHAHKRLFDILLAILQFLQIFTFFVPFLLKYYLITLTGVIQLHCLELTHSHFISRLDKLWISALKELFWMVFDKNVDLGT